MATQLRIKRGTTNANAPSGLTAGEMAINLVDKKLYVGGTAGTNVIFLDSTSSVGLSTANTFTALQTFSAGISASGATFSGPIQIPINTAPAITIGNDATRNLTLSSITRAGEIVQSGASNSQLNIRQESGGVVSIGDYAETLNSNYISVNDVDSVININGVEIYLNGTIVTPIVLGNAESIQNTVNGRIDFMPGPTAASAYGLYADLTGWGYGVKMGTINSAGTLDSSPGGILFMDRVTFYQDKFIGLASDGTHGLICTTQGLNTLQIGVYPGVANSNAVAIVGTDFTGTTNRSPVTSHTNPNLYIYRAGATSANDFIRIEHDGTNGNIVAGGTSGIKISGLLDVASGLSAAGATFAGTVNHQDNVLSRVELLDYFERFSDLGDFATASTQIPIDLSTAQVFRTKLTVTCTGLTLANVPDNGNANAVGFSLLFVGDGTARTMTWNIGSTAASWAGGTAPTYTSTANKIDVFSFLSRDGGSTWLGFVGGQNF